MTEHVSKTYNKCREEVKAELRGLSLKNIAVTLDIWSDRRMRGFLAITAHFYSGKTGALDSALIACDRFTGISTSSQY